LSQPPQLVGVDAILQFAWISVCDTCKLSDVPRSATTLSWYL